MSIMVKVLGLGCAALAAALAPTVAQAQSADADLKPFAVHINRTPQQPWPGYGIYLGNGLIVNRHPQPLVAAHNLIAIGEVLTVEPPAHVPMEARVISVVVHAHITMVPNRLKMERR